MTLDSCHSTWFPVSTTCHRPPLMGIRQHVFHIVAKSPPCLHMCSHWPQWQFDYLGLLAHVTQLGLRHRGPVRPQLDGDRGSSWSKAKEVHAINFEYAANLLHAQLMSYWLWIGAGWLHNLVRCFCQDNCRNTNEIIRDSFQRFMYFLTCGQWRGKRVMSKELKCSLALPHRKYRSAIESSSRVIYVFFPPRWQIQNTVPIGQTWKPSHDQPSSQPETYFCFYFFSLAGARAA